MRPVLLLPAETVNLFGPIGELLSPKDGIPNPHPKYATINFCMTAICAQLADGPHFVRKNDGLKPRKAKL